MLLIASLLVLASIVLAIVVLAATLPEILEMAKELSRQTLAEQGYQVTEEQLDLAIQAVKTSMIAGLIFAALIEGIMALGGFLFSLKGKWGMFCIIVGILSVVVEIFGFTNLGEGTTPANVVSKIISFLIAGLFCLASIMHYRENKALRDEATI